MIEKLAIKGGKQTIDYKFKKYFSQDEHELNAAIEVIKSKQLSGFAAEEGAEFCGGNKIQEFERLCENTFQVKHAVAVNSWTSGLICCVGSIDIQPGDEVIMPTWTMSAGATAILNWNAIPVFADIDPNTFNICPSSIKKNISPYTRAIIAVDIFGQSCDIEEILDIAKKYNIKVIGDSAQSPGTEINGKITGTLCDVGGFSLNRHKHIQTGEGGICVTNNKKIYEKLLLIRNHAEAVLNNRQHYDLQNMIGYNFRMGEIEAAMGIEQLKKMEMLVQKKRISAELLEKELCDIEEIELPYKKKNCSHAYYMFPMTLNTEKINVNRSKIKEALEAEGVQGLAEGYINIHRFPMFQNKISYGKNGFPWSSEICKRDVDYSVGICPVAENLQDNSYLGFEICEYDLNTEDIYLIGKAFKKVFSQLKEL